MIDSRKCPECGEVVALGAGVQVVKDGEIGVYHADPCWAKACQCGPILPGGVDIQTCEPHANGALEFGCVEMHERKLPEAKP